MQLISCSFGDWDGKISNILFYVEKPKTPGYAVEVEQASDSSITSSEVVEKVIDIAALMALGDVASGEKVFKKCAACHSINKGGKHKIGQLYIMLLEEKLEELRTTNILKR